MNELIIDYSEKRLFVRIIGEIDHHISADLRDKIDKAIYYYTPNELIIDLSCVDFMDSSGLGLLLGRHAKVTELGGEMRIANPPERIEEILNMAGCDRLIPIEKGVKRV